MSTFPDDVQDPCFSQFSGEFDIGIFESGSQQEENGGL